MFSERRTKRIRSACGVMDVSFVDCVDKWKARKGRWRIPEDSLIWLAVAGGSIGALGAMFLFRHKTRHLKFILGIPAILLLQVLLVFWLLRR